MDLKQCSLCKDITIRVGGPDHICEVCLYRKPLLEILTVIHNDPDEKYIDAAGLQKATNDAITKYVYLDELSKK